MIPLVSRICRAVPRYFLLSIAVALSLIVPVVYLLRWRVVLRAADVIVVVPGSGFGHTALVPDALRRLYAGQRILVLVQQRPFHNPHMGLIFPDVDVRYLPMTWVLGLGTFRGEYSPGPKLRHIFCAKLIGLLRKVTAAQVLAYGDLQTALNDHWRHQSDPRSTVSFQLAWYRLRRQRPAPPVRLLDAIRQPILEAVNRRSGRPLLKGFCCCIYLRSKGTDVTAQSRCGAPFIEHIPAIRYLTDRGYHVLLTGDRADEVKSSHDVGPMFLTADALGMPSHLFTLFAATEADIWIGNNGGGGSLGVLRDCPMLVLDMFPFGVAYPNAHLHYKSFTDSQGRPVPWDRLLQNHALDFHVNGLTVADNTAPEILVAVQEFLDYVRSEQGGRETNVLETLPGFIFEKACDCRLSPSWLRRHMSNSSRLAGKAVGLIGK